MALYLIPSFIGTESPDVLPRRTLNALFGIRCFIVEREKTARAFLKAVGHPVPQSEFIIHELDKHKQYDGFHSFFDKHIENYEIGVISEAGLPAIADPGSSIVMHAHKQGVSVVPLAGSSSLFLALMGSGLDGQNFSFSGYLPIQNDERIKRLKQLERNAGKSTQIFMETPYRNNAFFSFLLKHLDGQTRLCVAADLEMETETILTKSVSEWKNHKIDLNKRPCIYLIKA